VSAQRPDLGPAAERSAGAAAALCLLTVVTAASMARLFADSRWLAPVMTAAVVGHLVSWLARRWRLPVLASLGLTLAATGLLMAWMVLGHTTFAGLPTPATFSRGWHAIVYARSAFSNLAAPVPSLRGFVLTAMGAVALVAALSDWAAFRLQATMEATIAPVATLVFVAILGRPANRVAWSAAALAAIAVFVMVHRGARRAAVAARFTGGLGRPYVLSGAGVGIAVVVIVGAVLVGPHLPGAASAAVVAARHSGVSGPANRTTISPLVDVRYRLINESDTELFTVRSAVPEYWRLTALDHFDGNIWSSDEPYSPVQSRLPVKAVAGAQAVDQGYAISNLGSIWLPAAYLPVRLAGATGVSFDATSESLISQAATSDGEHYTVASAVPHFDGTELRGADMSSLSASVVTHYTTLPAVPDSIARLARRITAGDSTAYDKAKALQDYLRSHYGYSLDIPPGHSDSALVQFLFVVRQGYCEQFAAAYAVMARAIGLPTRVAVGFTPGTAEADGYWHVLGMHAHAWPEVLLGQFGWVPFDPTPGRGIPGSQAYTGVAPAQAAPAGGSSTITVPAQAVPQPAPTTTLPPRTPPPPANHPTPAHRRSAGAWALVGLVAFLGALAAVWVLGVPALKSMARHRRRRRARAGAEQVLVAWQEAAERLADAGAGRGRGETFLEHARRAAVSADLPPPAATALLELAGQAGAAAFGPEEASPASSELAHQRAAEVERAVLDSAGRWRRLGWELDPRPRSRRRPAGRRRSGQDRPAGGAGRGPRKPGYQRAGRA